MLEMLPWGWYLFLLKMLSAGLGCFSSFVFRKACRGTETGGLCVCVCVRESVCVYACACVQVYVCERVSFLLFRFLRGGGGA